MIPKADIRERASIQRLQATTVEKDYVLGGVLRAIAVDEELSRWVFKGGTCLKKCFFETYRFSAWVLETYWRRPQLGTARPKARTR